MDTSPSPELLKLDNLKAIKILGKGAMGTVFLVYNHLSDPSATSPFALKVVEKSYFQHKLDANRRARWEIFILSKFNQDTTNPFLPNLLGSFETDEFLAWAIPFCPGGDLNVLRYKQNDKCFSPAVIRFYLAEIVCALEHLHNMSIVYRDLKPENILIQQSGHVILTDFDLSRRLTSPSRKDCPLPSEPIQQQPRKHRRNITRLFPMVVGNNNNKKDRLKKAKSARVSPISRRHSSFSNGERSNSFVGTEEYVAPEMVRGEGHEFSIDWWALGVLSYEMLYGTTPFRGQNRKDTFRRILMMSPEFVGRSTTLTDLIGKLLVKEPTRRLGYQRGASEIKEHPFFQGLRWDLLTDVVRPPFLPSKDDGDLTKGVKCSGTNIMEYFQKLRAPPSPLDSPMDDRKHNVSLTEF